MTVVWSRDLPADPSSVRVYQDSTGAWYASFVVPAETEPLPQDASHLRGDLDLVHAGCQTEAEQAQPVAVRVRLDVGLGDTRDRAQRGDDLRVVGHGHVLLPP